MHRSLLVVAKPAVEPVEISELNDFLRLQDPDDAVSDALIRAARERLESYTGRAFITQDWKLFLDKFPADDTAIIEIPRPPLQSVTSLKYVDTNGVTQTLAATEYSVDASSEPGRVSPAFGKSWPNARDIPNAIEILFRAGYGLLATDVPERIRMAIRQIAAQWFEHRDTVLETGFHPPIPAVNMAELVGSYRVVTF